MLTGGPIRALLQSDPQVELIHLVDELYISVRMISSAKHRTTDRMWRVVRLANRLNVLGYGVLYKHTGNTMVGASSLRLAEMPWVLAQEAASQPKPLTK